MLGGIVKGIGSGLATGIADVAGLGSFTSALGAEKPKDKPKAVEPKPFDEDEAPTKVLQRIFSEVQTIHKVIASQIVPASEEKEEQMDKDKKDDEVLDALEDLRPEEEKDKKKKKSSWWKTAAMAIWTAIKAFVSWILKPLSWIKSLLKLPFIMGLVRFATFALRFFLFNPVGIALLTIGIIAINWRAIKKTIKGYWATFKGWVKNTLNWVGLGGLLEDDPEDKIVVDEDAGEDPVGEVEKDKPRSFMESSTTIAEQVSSADDVSQGVGSTDAATGATIVGPDFPVVVTPDTAGEDQGALITQSAVEADDGWTAEDDAMFKDDDSEMPESTSYTGTVSGATEDQAAYFASKGIGSTDAVSQGDDEYVRKYGTKFEPNPDLDFTIWPIRAYNKLTTNKERLEWLDKKIKLTERSDFMALPERDLSIKASGQMRDERERVLEYAGQFQTGGMIPKGKVGLAGEGSAPESVKGTMLGGPSLVEGPARVRRESGLDKKKAMKETGSDFAMGQYLPRQILGKTRDKDFMKKGIFPGSSFYIELQEEIGNSTIQNAMVGPDGNIDMGDAQFELPNARQARDLYKNAMRGGMQKPKTIEAWMAISPEVDKAIRSEIKKGNYPPALLDTGFTPEGWFAHEKIRYATITGHIKTDAEVMKEYDRLVDEGYRLNKWGEWQDEDWESLVSVAGKYVGKKVKPSLAYLAGGSRLSHQTLPGFEKSGAGAMTWGTAKQAMFDAPRLEKEFDKFFGIDKMTFKEDTTLHQAGQQPITKIVTDTTTTNVSTASSSSNQANVGQTQQSIPISNTHGAAPRSV